MHIRSELATNWYSTLDFRRTMKTNLQDLLKFVQYFEILRSYRYFCRFSSLSKVSSNVSMINVILHSLGYNVCANFTAIFHSDQRILFA